MDPKNNIICCGCLSYGRKMHLIDEYWEKQCFLQIISEILMSQPETEPVSLCWECEVQLRNFTRFKQKVKHSYKTYEKYLKQNKTNYTEINTKPRFTMHTLTNISLLNTAEHTTTEYQIIKPEDCSLDDYDNTFGDTNSNEDKPLKMMTTKPLNIETKKLNSEVWLREEDKIHDEETMQACTEFADTNEMDKLVCVKKEKKVRVVINGEVKRKKRKSKGPVNVYTEVELSREELEEERRLAVLKEEYVNAMFKCARCIVCFANAEDLKDHIHLKHELNSSKHRCDICECSFASEVSYNYHASKHAKRYECVACTTRSGSKRAAAKHFEQHHCHGTVLEFKIQDTNWDKGRSADKSADGEDKNTKQTSTFPCGLCDKSFKWKTSLRKHVETHRIETGQKRKPYCEPCRLSFTTTSNLQKHVKTSSKHQIQLKLRKLKESLPEEAASPEKEQARIEEIKCSVNSARQVFPCPQCDKRFQWRGNMLRHVQSHAARVKGELVCGPCNRTFSSIATYKQHMKISKRHVSENDFKYMCSDCGKRFANKTRLKDHINWEHLKNYVHTCSVCQKVFKSHTSLYLHKQVVHMKDKTEHLCHHCGKPFPNQAKLRVHVRAVHAGGVAAGGGVSCGACGARFSRLSCLSRHARRTHAPDNT